MTLDRRQLLSGGLSAGALTWVQPAWGELNYPGTRARPRLSRGSGRGAHVLILGAGMAGLVAGYELSRAGYRITILEARDRPGGRVWTIRGDDLVEQIGRPDQRCTFDRGLYFNAGAGRLPHWHTATIGYAREFGVDLEIIASVNRNVAYDIGEPVQARQAHADTRGRFAELLALAIRRGALNGQLESADQTAALDFLRGYAGLDTNYEYHGSTRAGFAQAPGAGPLAPTPIAPLSLRDVISRRFWEVGLQFDDWPDQQPTMLEPVGGMDRIPFALYHRLRSHVVLGAEVVRLRNSESGVSAVFLRGGRQHEIAADYCICTLPLPPLAKVDTDFSERRKQAIAAQPYFEGVKVAFQARRFWEQDDYVYGGIAWSESPAEVLWYPSADIGDAQGVLVAAYSTGFFDLHRTEAFAALTNEERFSVSRALVERLHPGRSGELRKPITVSWTQTRYSEGLCVNWDSGRGEAYELLCAPEARTFFAGEHLTYLEAWIEGAVLSAWAAVADLHTRAHPSG